MILKPIDQIKKEDINALIENEVAENKTIEYKLTLPDDSDRQKKEFLADISSFANAGGGDILFGVEEKKDGDNQSTGIPKKAVGLAGKNSDQEILRLENIIREGMDPRIPGIHIQPIEGFSDAPLILIRIPKSWASPHMIIFKGWNRFYSRTSNGKYLLDVAEIRSAILASGSLAEKIKKFRDERIADILKGENPVPIDQYTKVVLHVIPLTFDDPNSVIDIKKAQSKLQYVRPLRMPGGSARFNFDGYLTFDLLPDGKSTSYMQFFRSGIIETVSGKLIRTRDSKKIIACIAFEKAIISSIGEYLKLYRELNLAPPFIVMLSLLDIKGYVMSTGGNYTSPSSIEKDHLLFPEIVIEDFELSADKIVKPLFDMVWQACGCEGSPHYNSQGKWEEFASGK